MLKEPLYKYVPTFRNYEDYHDAEQYTKGWNDAIDALLSGAGDTDMKYEDIKNLLKNFLMNQYDIRPSLAERTVDEMFRKGAEYISLEEQRSKNEL